MQIIYVVRNGRQALNQIPSECINLWRKLSSSMFSWAWSERRGGIKEHIQCHFIFCSFSLFLFVLLGQMNEWIDGWMDGWLTSRWIGRSVVWLVGRSVGRSVCFLMGADRMIYVHGISLKRIIREMGHYSYLSKWIVKSASSVSNYHIFEKLERLPFIYACKYAREKETERERESQTCVYI